MVGAARHWLDGGQEFGAAGCGDGGLQWLMLLVLLVTDGGFVLFFFWFGRLFEGCLSTWSWDAGGIVVIAVFFSFVSGVALLHTDRCLCGLCS